jgi:quinol monooxygenase YgiN
VITDKTHTRKGERNVSVYVIWETWLKEGAEREGLMLTQHIWRDMRSYSGYQGHLLLQDQDQPGHLIVVGRWTTREQADRIRDDYARSSTVQQLKPLLARERTRSVHDALEANGVLI